MCGIAYNCLSVSILTPLSLSHNRSLQYIVLIMIFSVINKFFFVSISFSLCIFLCLCLPLKLSVSILLSLSLSAIDYSIHFSNYNIGLQENCSFFLPVFLLLSVSFFTCRSLFFEIDHFNIFS